MLAPPSPRTCSSATQDARTCAADIPSRHLGPAPPPPRTYACLGHERMDRELPPRLDLQLPQARPGPQVISRDWNLELVLLLLPYSCCCLDVPCSCVVAGVP
ncbi:hypothetical protein D1007_42508 [Hordeum vulgare]|nr:hypothetical protein D1007_42508 [Hordeum vulgare]